MSHSSHSGCSFAEVSVSTLIQQLTTEEKVSLLAGTGWWNTTPVPRLGIPSIKVSDGPNGARGGSFFKMTPAVALPNATCLAASFSHDLLQRAGNLLAEETKARGAACLLAPTVNIARSPLGGRVFESFSEDPTLSGHMAADYITGLQAKGVSAVIKHFVANDQEHERTGYNAIISERALREVYLRPFQLAQKKSSPWAYMTSYNKVNGLHASENTSLVNVLRDEWNFDGLVMSDWYGTYSVAESINAGLDLEMPGPSIWRNWLQVNHLITARKIDPEQIDKLAGNVLTWVQKLFRANGQLDPAERTRTEDHASDAKLLRQLAAKGAVLLKNEHDVLPLKASDGSLAVIGPNSKIASVTGGGSAALNPSWTSTPWQALCDANPGLGITHGPGCIGAKFLPLLDDAFTRGNGDVGLDLAHYALDDDKQASKPTVLDHSRNSSVFLCDFVDERLGEMYLTELTATFTAPATCEYEFGLAVSGQGWLWLDDELVIDHSINQVRGGPNSAFSGTATTERRGRIAVQEGKKYSLRVLHDARLPPPEHRGGSVAFDEVVAFRVGADRVSDEAQMEEAAIALAGAVDKVVLFVGLNADWESEGFDRASLSLPLGQDALISKIGAVNSNTIVVIQAGSAVAMPWIEQVAGVVYAWYGGNECGNAIADILYGTVNPSGRLPLTLPRREVDVPAYNNFKCADGDVHYEEGIWVGYRHYNARQLQPLFPFGHGLSYTTFDYEDFSIERRTEDPQWRCTVGVTVRNTGSVDGSHSVHLYTCPPPAKPSGMTHPSHTIQAYEKTRVLKPGESQRLYMTLDRDALSHWSTRRHCWTVEEGEWHVRIGINARTLTGDLSFRIDQRMEWNGL